MSNEIRKLLTIITESDLEKKLVKDLIEWGISGYTITDARGKGNRGERDANWDNSANIRIEIICNDAIAHKVMEALNEKYYESYAMVSFIIDIEVLRPNKF